MPRLTTTGDGRQWPDGFARYIRKKRLHASKTDAPNVGVSNAPRVIVYERTNAQRGTHTFGIPSNTSNSPYIPPRLHGNCHKHNEKNAGLDLHSVVQRGTAVRSGAGRDEKGAGIAVQKRPHRHDAEEWWQGAGHRKIDICSPATHLTTRQKNAKSLPPLRRSFE